MNEVYAICFTHAICVLSIFTYEWLLPKTWCDPLGKSFDRGLDGWSLTHIGYYSYLSYNYPNQIQVLLITGVLWEIFEHFYGIITKNRWWFGRFEDLCMNGIGIYIGLELKSYYLSYT